MTLVLLGHCFKYEVEATVKLFFPAQHFTFLTELPDVAEDCIVTRRTQTPDGFSFAAEAFLPAGHDTRTASLPSDAPQPQQEHLLCDLLYALLTTLTDIRPRWGMMTGIRPVKLLLDRIRSGEPEEQAANYLRREYHVSEDRLSLALETARVQAPMLLPFDPKTVSLYIAIPFCPTRCSYCSFVSQAIANAGKLMVPYVDCLCRELRILGKLVREQKLRLSTVYIGGGTPTTLSAQQLAAVMGTVRDCFDLSPIREYTVEAGRPDTIDREKLAVLLAYGADRISINPQTFNDAVLAGIGRRHTAQQCVDAFALAREVGHKNINMDLIAGLPDDTAPSFRDTLRRVIALAPENVTVHTLTLKRSATLYPEGAEQLANPAAEMVADSRAMLTAAGYRPYYLYRQKNTVDNLENVGWAKPGTESLYNILMMDETQSILGAGCGASTKLVTTGKITRIHNYKFPYEYIGRFDALMEKKQEIHLA